MKVLLRVLLLLIVVGGGSAAAWYWKVRQTESSGHDLILYGNVDVRQVELAINGSERIGRVLVEEGDRVEPNQLLAELELERFQLAVDRVEAQIETQQQIVARLEAGTRPEEIREARAALEAARATLTDAAATFKRTEELKKRNVATDQDVDDARSKRDLATANVRNAEAALELAIAGPRKEDIAEAKAVLSRLKVELSQAMHDLRDASLYAPSRGIVQERILEVGDMASPQKPVFTVALIDPVWVRAYVSETDLGKIHEGMNAT
ncbi:MAG: efflux RND transporter periplasmic adaptor subunit, partial [Planctomycetes bacterium]|nr:efflux RND transporter periplasmic adaptor subunit [Planctomycetota bacterium]